MGALNILLSTLLLLLFVTFVGGHPHPPYDCNCDMKHPQEQFCNADYVIKAKILAVEDVYTPTTATRYTVHVKKVFKGNLTVSCSQYLYTEKDMPCTAKLKVNKTYIITGSIEEGEKRVDACDWTQRFRTLTRHQRRSLNGLYGENCHCEIGKSRCRMRFAIRDRCYKRYTTCVDTGEVNKKCNPKCKWEKGPGFDICKLR